MAGYYARAKENGVTSYELVAARRNPDLAKRVEDLVVGLGGVVEPSPRFIISIIESDPGDREWIKADGYPDAENFEKAFCEAFPGHILTDLDKTENAHAVSLNQKGMTYIP
jgi:hypothetical protein